MEKQIINYLEINPKSSSKEIFEKIDTSKSFATFKRVIARQTAQQFIISEGVGRATRYSISPFYSVIKNIDINTYYEKEIDERTIKENFNF